MIFGECPAPILDHKTIVLGHGSGGKLTHQLIQKMILPAFRNPVLETQHDGAVVSIGGTRVAFSTDSYVVNPIFFPGRPQGSPVQYYEAGMDNPCLVRVSTRVAGVAGS